jgi:hypothetical protein
MIRPNIYKPTSTVPPWGSQLDDASGPDVRALWLRKQVAMIYLSGEEERLLVSLPYADANRKWLRDGRHHKPRWNDSYRCWELPKAWLNDLVKEVVARYDKVYLIQPYGAHEKCAPACWNAEGFECECSCMGANHGAGAPPDPWTIVSETFAFRGIGQDLSCRLITRGWAHTGVLPFAQ